MDWRDDGILLTVRRHGESAAIIDVFTAGHGRHAGVVRGGGSQRMAPLLQPGAQIAVEWHARLSDHLGAFRVEPIRSRATNLMTNGDTLAAIGAVSALLTVCLAEREPRPDLYAATVSLLDLVGSAPDWPSAYVAWEMMLMADLGFPLDLSCCAVTGTTEDLAFVSPKTGRAVSKIAAGPYQDRLLPMPDFQAGGREAVAVGLSLTGHFLLKWVAPALGLSQLPEARTRLADRLSRTILHK